MFRRGKKAEPEKPEVPNALKDAVREARIEAAERSAVVVDLRDAELARLELLNEALDPLFADIPAGVELFDRGISRGDVPRLWIDMIAHVEMGRDKRQYRFVQDTRYGRAVLGESHDIPDIVHNVTRYVACRLQKVIAQERRRSRWRALRTFVFGIVVGAAVLVALALAYRPHP
jgi:hypothetical protein